MDALDEWAAWANENLPGTPEQYVTKAKAEWDEFLADEDALEAVDVIMCLAAGIRALGYSPSELVALKHAQNRHRTWERQPDGTYQHV
jgi:hypothetical protein